MKGKICDINMTSMAHKQSIVFILGHSVKLLACPCMGILFFLSYLSQDQQIHSDSPLKHLLHISGVYRETINLSYFFSTQTSSKCHNICWLLLNCHKKSSESRYT